MNEKVYYSQATDVETKAQRSDSLPGSLRRLVAKCSFDLAGCLSALWGFPESGRVMTMSLAQRTGAYSRQWP